MTIKCVITDDEPVARKGLQSYVERVDFLELIGVCEDAIQLNTLLKTQQPDLLLLDIEMPYLSGLDLLATLTNPPKIIITSAYEQYALKGYEFNVSDYLLKPISFERFLKAANKIYDAMQKEEGNAEAEQYIFVKYERQIKKIYLKDILFVEGEENYVYIYTLSEKIMVRSTMKHILESLPEGCFLQIHKSYVVNIAHISNVEGNMLGIGEYKVPIARNYREEVFNRIMKNML